VPLKLVATDEEAIFPLPKARIQDHEQILSYHSIINRQSHGRGLEKSFMISNDARPEPILTNLPAGKTWFYHELYFGRKLRVARGMSEGCQKEGMKSRHFSHPIWYPGFIYGKSSRDDFPLINGGPLFMTIKSECRFTARLLLPFLQRNNRSPSPSTLGQNPEPHLGTKIVPLRPGTRFPFEGDQFSQ
jgi:hypothetical protein